MQLIKGAPALRRKFIDVELGQIKPIYLSDLSSYNHVLKQRNAYLKSTEKVDNTFLSVLDHQLAEYGSRVIQHRIDFLKIRIAWQQQSSRNLKSKETLTIQYLSSVNLTNSVNLIDTFLTELENSRKRDLFKKIQV